VVVVVAALGYSWSCERRSCKFCGCWAFGCYVVKVGHGGRFAVRMSSALGLFHILHLTALGISTLPFYSPWFIYCPCLRGIVFSLLGLHSVLGMFCHIRNRRNGLKGTSILHRVRRLCKNACFLPMSLFTSVSFFLGIL
jgi:hypothetical protein